MKEGRYSYGALGPMALASLDRIGEASADAVLLDLVYEELGEDGLKLTEESYELACHLHLPVRRALWRLVNEGQVEVVKGMKFRRRTTCKSN